MQAESELPIRVQSVIALQQAAKEAISSHTPWQQREYQKEYWEQQKWN